MNEPLKSRIDFKEPILQEEVTLKKVLALMKMSNFCLLIHNWMRRMKGN